MITSLAEVLVELVLEPVLEWACYFVGRAVISGVSLGRWKSERRLPSTRSRRLGLTPFYRPRRQQADFSVDATEGVGFAVLVLLCGAGLLVWYLASR